SSVARRLAKALGWQYVDTDEEIEKQLGKSISDIFAQEGENYFRMVESQVLRQACMGQNRVIASGGGSVLSTENRELMKARGLVVLLEAEPETVYQRLIKDSKGPNPTIRPLLTVSDPMARIKELKTFRQTYYSFAHAVIPNDNLSLDETTQEVLRRWNWWTAPAAAEVNTATQSYPIFVGWGYLDGLGLFLHRVGSQGKAVLISDEAVYSHYGEKAISSLKEGGFEVISFAVPPGETSKALDMAQKLYDFLVEKRVERGDVVVALGGGMVGDLAGFVAATFLRGLALVQVPTSLAAMVDASIGGKVAVNHRLGKNLIGAFHQPTLVVADVQALSTLPPRELTSGWAEVIKHAFILDEKLLQVMEEEAPRLKALEPAITSEVIAWSARLKAGVVSQDEREAGKRTILNYGHTIGHALETVTNYERYLHGEAVAIGMMAAAKLSHRLGLLSTEAVERHRSLLLRFGLPVSAPGINPDAILEATELDKKTREGALHWVLLHREGGVVLRSQIPETDVLAVLQEVL
ncbi:MAG: 3-dehydroquinate synthase, partial [Chloroflexota bacterium]